MDLHPKMTPAFYHGYILLLEAILHIILKDPESESDNPSVIPTISVVSKRLIDIQDAAANLKQGEDNETQSATATEAQCIQAYLSSGGKVDFGLDALTDSAFEKSPDGSLYRRQQYLQEEEAEFEKVVADLPRCENDLDFGLVREKLGISRERLGPYWFFLTDSEGEDDEEDTGDGEETVYEGVRSG